MLIAVDFDGTIVEHRFPIIGPEIPGAFSWLRKYQEAGAYLILWTVRDGLFLQRAVDFCKGRGVTFWAVNHCPLQRDWSKSPKAYAELYIDDLAFGIPVIKSKDGGCPAFVDWSIVGPSVMQKIKDGKK